MVDQFRRKKLDYITLLIDEMIADMLKKNLTSVKFVRLLTLWRIRQGQ